VNYVCPDVAGRVHPNRATYSAAWHALRELAYMLTKNKSLSEYKAAVKLVQRTFLKATSNEDATLYLHGLLHTIEDVELVSLWRSSGQGMEHVNKQFKGGQCNNKPVGSKARVTKEGVVVYQSVSRVQQSFVHHAAKRSIVETVEMRKKRACKPSLFAQ